MKLKVFGIFRSSYFLVLLILFSGFFIELQAQANSVKHVEANLISNVQSIQPGQPFLVALHLKMEEHWHTYWKNAGDSGRPTKIEWKLPNGFQNGQIQWPFPKKISAAGLTTYGYEGEVLLITEVIAPKSLKNASAVELSAKVSWLVCREVCLPEETEVNLRLPVSNSTPLPSSWAAMFAQTQKKLPLQNSEWKIQAAIKGDLILINLIQPASFKKTLTDVSFFPEKNSIIDLNEIQKLTKKQNGYLLELKRPTPSEPLTELSGILVSSKGWQNQDTEEALQLNIKIEPLESLKLTENISQIQTTKSFPIQLFLAICSAFVGGLILNLMPCVLPVLSIKVLGFVHQAREDKSKIRQHGLVFTAGVIISFWILAGILIILRASGEKLAWGFQLQSPTFVIILSSLFFLFSLNLLGVFEIGTSLMNLGNIKKSGLMGSFFNGVMATIVATPCTAPFMGSALGLALTLSPWASMLIFTFLAIGMAFPYLLLSYIPAFLRFVPKPGHWMEIFKQSMGFLLVSAVIFLAWVLGNQTGVDGIIFLLISLTATAIGAWILGRWGSFLNSNRSQIFSYAISFIFIFSGILFASSNAKYITKQNSLSTNNNNSIQWEPFSPKRVEELRAQGKPVFIDFTAAWCLSCQVNERVALNSLEVQNQFRKLGIVALKADWTLRDETITQTLTQFGRSGVPLYILYGKNPETPPIILPEILTPNIVLDTLKQLDNT